LEEKVPGINKDALGGNSKKANHISRTIVKLHLKINEKRTKSLEEGQSYSWGRTGKKIVIGRGTNTTDITFGKNPFGGAKESLIRKQRNRQKKNKANQRGKGPRNEHA